MKPSASLLLLLLLLTNRTSVAQTTFQVGTTTVNVAEKATDLNVPWDMVVGPDGWIWFTEIDGRVSRLDPDNGTLELIYTVPDVYETGLGGGLQSMAFHPDFANAPYVYLHYVNSSSTSVVKRFYYDAGLNTFTSTSAHLLDLVLHGGASHNGSRIVVDDTGALLLSIGDAMSGSALVQDLSTSNGKVLRFDTLGGVPPDNPIPGSYVYNWGHRNPQGLIKASNGRIYNSAHGAGYDDEVNIIEPNRNYGWPTVLGYCTSPTEIAYCEANNVKEPIHEWTAEIVAPSGIDYYDHVAIPGWQNSILVATLRGKALHQLKLNATGDTVVSSAAFLYQVFGRLRDVLCFPDGRVFISTSNNDWAGAPAANDDRILELSAAVPTGLATIRADGFGLWPNPATATVRITGEIAGPCEVVLHDASGRAVYRTVTSNWQFDVSSLAPGLYNAVVRAGSVKHLAGLFVVPR